MGFCHIHRRLSDGLPTAFPTLIPTEYNPSVFHRKLQKNYRILPHSPMDFRRIADGVSDSNTDGITDGLSHACLTRVRLHEYQRHFRRCIPTALPTDHACLSARIPTALPTEYTNGITDGSRMSDTCPAARIPTTFPMELPTDRKV